LNGIMMFFIHHLSHEKKIHPYCWSRGTHRID
jgi:hypothetical protein